MSTSTLKAVQKVNSFVLEPHREKPSEFRERERGIAVNIYIYYREDIIKKYLERERSERREEKRR